jgi:hypothetical protein
MLEEETTCHIDIVIKEKMTSMIHSIRLFYSAFSIYKIDNYSFAFLKHRQQKMIKGIEKKRRFHLFSYKRTQQSLN